MAQYVSYFDCTGWRCHVELMNLGVSGFCKVSAYTRLGTTQIDDIPQWTQEYSLGCHQTLRIDLNEVPTLDEEEGKIVVTSEGIESGAECVAFLVIRADSQDYQSGNRFVPFIRVP